MASKPTKKAKNMSLDEDLVRAVEMLLITKKGKRGIPKDFSAAVHRGLMLLLNHSKTSVPKLLAQMEAAQ